MYSYEERMRAGGDPNVPEQWQKVPKSATWWHKVVDGPLVASYKYHVGSRTFLHLISLFL